MKNASSNFSNKPYKKPFKGNKKGIATNFAEEFGNSKTWYQEFPDDPEHFPKVSDEILIALKDEAKKCNDSEVATYSIKNTKTNSDYQWMKTVMSKGTVSDKIAAYTLLIQDDPICNLATINNMINMVKVGKKKECVSVIDTLSELFLSDLLRPNVKLKPFYERPLSKLDELSSGNAGTRRKYLSIWYFEDQLKECYTTFVQALNTAAQDTVDSNKEKAINAMYKLLIGNPEQEKNLLSNIVNKLGDPSQKVASKAIYCLGQVLYEHPNMKQVVLNEIERLLFRPNVAPKAQYYGICFLNQFYLSHEDYEVAKNLIGVYFAFFKACIKKEEVDSRMMSALLIGVNRAYPFAQSELSKISEHIDTMYKVVHMSTFNVSLHALNLLYQISDHNNAIKDRFYSALYRKLFDPQIGATKYQALFLNLVFRSVKKDENTGRMRAFVKRLLQLALYMQPAMTCGILYLVQQLMHKNKNLLAIKSISDELFDNDDNEPEKYEDVPTEDDTTSNNILNKSTEEVKSENEEEKSSNKDEKEEKADIEIVNVPNGSWNHSKIAIKSEYTHPEIKSYIALQRNPLYAGGEFCVYLELLILQQHFHPTVALFANKILNAENIIYSGDPLKDFNLIRFLERFSFKNPKKAGDMPKRGINPVFGRRQLTVPTGVKSHAVNSTTYLNLNKKKIPVEELFMYNYLQKKHQEKKKAVKEDDSDLESVASDEFDEMLEKMSGAKNMEEDLDFMTDIGESLKIQKKGKKNKEESDDDDDDDDEDEDEENDNQSDDDEMQFSGDEDFEDEDMDGFENNQGGFEDHADDEDDDLDFEDNDADLDSDLEVEDEKPAKTKKKLLKKGKKKGDMNSVFASADEFASLLDEEPDFMAGSSQAVSNKDNAHLKQLSWEQNRHRWVKGFDNSVGKGKKNFQNKNKQFSKKRPKSQQPGNKNKKQKKH